MPMLACIDPDIFIMNLIN